MQEWPRLGKILKGVTVRDAVHVAILPVVAGEKLDPGQQVDLLSDLRTAHPALVKGSCVGVVDPFLPFAVQPGQWFYLLLPPGSITSLRHDWTHPAIDGEEPT